MMEEKVITMKSEMKTLSSENQMLLERHICLEEVATENQVEYDYDDDVLGDVDYDSDCIEEQLSSRNNKTSHRLYYDAENIAHDWEEEEEFSDEEDDDDQNDVEEDRQIKHAIYLKSQNKKYADTLEKLSVLDGKLNWLEKIPVNQQVVFDNKEYPALNKKSPRKQTAKISPSKYSPANHIEIRVGKKTYIGLSIPKTNYKTTALCRFIANGVECKMGEKCRFSHGEQRQQQSMMQSNKLCNAIRDGRECRFEDRCKFSHNIEQYRQERQEMSRQETMRMRHEQQKPNCKYGTNCGNRKCTFVHPDGKSASPRISKSDNSVVEVALKTGSPRKASGSSVGVTTSFDNELFRKIWLCKNMFNVVKDSTNLVKIEETGKCRFGDHCVYAHSIEEVRQNLDHCKFNEDCKAVKITQIKKDDKKVRRYENNLESRKCCRLHPKERIIDFIKRIQ